MRIYDGGKVREATEAEVAEYENVTANITPLTYEERIVMRIREKYSIDDELALLRQKDSKPEEFAEYNHFVEQIKSEEA